MLALAPASTDPLDPYETLFLAGSDIRAAADHIYLASRIDGTDDVQARVDARRALERGLRALDEWEGRT
jgi:hypothetical protein